ncbi:hypothetical protein V490_01755 [Pseudogymnoascus sp. VKM F-3557]|nr:hypothetical protein V490_01755 [Pseudogymnoascus sp. VKM F-3557]
MSSFFFSTTSPPKARYLIPPPLDYETVLGILHNETLLHQVLYPELYSTLVQEDENKIGREKRPAPDTAQPDPTVSFSPLSNGISCIEEMPLGFTATTIYTLSTSPDSSATSPDPSSLNQAPPSSSDPTLYLEEHRSLRALKPITRWVTHAEGPILKTRNLLRFLEEASAGEGGLGKDIDHAAALARASLYSLPAGKTDKFKDE